VREISCRRTVATATVVAGGGSEEWTFMEGEHALTQETPVKRRTIAQVFDFPEDVMFTVISFPHSANFDSPPNA
jgi:hypothetical protein